MSRDGSLPAEESEEDKKGDEMNALKKLVNRCNEMDITEQINYLGDAIMPGRANAELAAMQAVIEAARKVEFDETTGECLFGCGGDSIDGHTDGCVFVPVAMKLAALDRVTK